MRPALFLFSVFLLRLRPTRGRRRTALSPRAFLSLRRFLFFVRCRPGIFPARASFAVDPLAGALCFAELSSPAPSAKRPALAPWLIPLFALQRAPQPTSTRWAHFVSPRVPPLCPSTSSRRLPSQCAPSTVVLVAPSALFFFFFLFSFSPHVLSCLSRSLVTSRSFFFLSFLLFFVPFFFVLSPSVRVRCLALRSSADPQAFCAARSSLCRLCLWALSSLSSFFSLPLSEPFSSCRRACAAACRASGRMPRARVGNDRHIDGKERANE